jgi:cell wall-associated NlpC family hydrolase
MEHKICVVPVMPLRAEPSHKSEMTSQLIFGECAVVLEENNQGWVRLRNQYDQYEGWAMPNQMACIKEELYYEPTEEYSREVMTPASVSGHPMNIGLGSFLKGLHHGEMHWGRVVVKYKGDPIKPDHQPVTERNIRHLAFQFLNTPYLWGGRSIFGIDCSGFTQTVYRLVGKALPRDAHMQARCGKQLQKDDKPRCGDLAFFSNEEGNITHVGMMLNDFEIIHASGKVRVDSLDQYGIRNADTGKHTHKLAFTRRFF